jgi:hypothetical protein
MFSDIVLFSGDLTSQSLHSEFQLAKQELQPTLDKFVSSLCFVAVVVSCRYCTFMIPGNHDIYTKPVARQRLFDSYFSQWMHLPASHASANATANSSSPSSAIRLPILTQDNVTIVGLNPCRPTGIGSRGYYPPEQVSSLLILCNTHFNGS